MGIGTHDPNFSTEMAEGTAPSGAKIVKSRIQDPAATFMRYVVLEVIPDPDPRIVTEEKIVYWTQILGVTNSDYSRLLPRNTIIGQRMNSGRGSVARPMFLFPFFPSHLSLPCKPGESVWAMFEDPNAYERRLGFWFCRISEPHIIDDVNHTHGVGKLDITRNPGLIKKFNGKVESVYELQNGAVKIKDGAREVINGTRVIDPPSVFNTIEVFEQLVTETEASKLIQYEAIPRFKKRPGDIAIEGSNNTLIVLGTNRTGSIANFVPSEYPDDVGPVPVKEEKFYGKAGSIDLVAGRGYTAKTGGTETITSRISSVSGSKEEIKKEIEKNPELLSAAEGDPDFSNDRSRVLLSQRTMTDKSFNLDMYNAQFGITDSETSGDASIVIKSDKVRVVARSDISFIVTNYSPVPPLDNKPGFKLDSNNLSNWASITIKTNGDIVFTPSEKGVVKLGGESADRAILCTARPAANEEGVVSSLPIATTAGGFVGTSGGKLDADAAAGVTKPDLGTFASKILVTAAT